MSTPHQHPHGPAPTEEKPALEHVETANVLASDELSVVGAKVADSGKTDYSGFAQKTDPKEIKLVRKLDMYIMVGAHQLLIP